MEKARQIIREVLSTAKHPAVMWSGGKDSQLLLALVREIDKSVPVIWFRTRQNEGFAKKMIMDWDLEAWSWEPSDVYLLPNENGLSLVREQAFGSQRFPVVMDIEDGNKCIGEVLTERTPQLFPHFDAILIGYKDSDSHWVLGGSGFCPADGWTLGQAKVFAPLRHLMDSDVWQAIRKLGVPYDVDRYEKGMDPDSLQACTSCLQTGSDQAWCKKEKKYIERLSWAPQERLKEFQKRFGFREAA